MTCHARIISASILSADLARLGEDVMKAIEAGAERIHIDVMDQHYVPNLGFGPLILTSLKNYGISVPLDVHLMVQPVDDMIKAFASAGAHSICFHPEASLHIDRSLSLIKNLGCEAGLALNPATPIDVLTYLWEKLDRILVMSVNPGFGGQTFIPAMLEKTKRLREMIDSKKLKITLEVDGGITPANIKTINEHGAEMFVVGSALFNSTQRDYKKTLSLLKN